MSDTPAPATDPATEPAPAADPQAAGAPAPLIATALLADYDSSTPIALYVIAAAVLTLIAVGVAKETRHRDLARVEAEPGQESAVASSADARTA